MVLLSIRVAVFVGVGAQTKCADTAFSGYRGFYFFTTRSDTIAIGLVTRPVAHSF